MRTWMNAQSYAACVPRIFVWMQYAFWKYYEESIVNFFWLINLLNGWKYYSVSASGGMREITIGVA